MNGCGVEIQALADTGANGYLFINQTLANFLIKSIGAKIQDLPYSVPIRGYNSSIRSLAKQFIRLHLTVDGRLIKNCPFIIMDLGDQDMILGLKWFRHFRVRLDSHQNRLLWPSAYPPTPSWVKILRIPYTSGKSLRVNSYFQTDVNRRDKAIYHDEYRQSKGLGEIPLSLIAPRDPAPDAPTPIPPRNAPVTPPIQHRGFSICQIGANAFHFNMKQSRTEFF